MRAAHEWSTSAITATTTRMWHQPARDLEDEEAEQPQDDEEGGETC